MKKRSELIAAIVRNYLGMPPLYHEQGYGLNPACFLSIFIRYCFGTHWKYTKRITLKCHTNRERKGRKSSYSYAQNKSDYSEYTSFSLGKKNTGLREGSRIHIYINYIINYTFPFFTSLKLVSNVRYNCGLSFFISF